METIFAQREAALWSQAVAWTFMMDCMKDFVEHFDPQSFAQAQNELVESYEGLEDFFDGLNEMADITDNLFTVNPTSEWSLVIWTLDYTEDFPEVDMNEVLGDLHQRQLDDQLNAMMVENNVPVDHNLFQLFFEALNPAMNANELNDDDVAALQEQMNEILNAQPEAPQEEVWQEDWNSDEEYTVWYKQYTHPMFSLLSAHDSLE